MTLGTENLLASVIRITEERDKKSLETALVEALADYVEADAIILLRKAQDGETLELAVAAPGNARQDRFELLTQEAGERRIKWDVGLKRCIDQGGIVLEAQHGRPRCLFPVVTKEKGSGVLAIYGNDGGEDQITLVRGFLRIYGNFLAVLDDNEHDTLTGLLNRRAFDTRISELISSSLANAKSDSTSGVERRKTSSATSHWLGILDIDHFKKINDTFGHVYGDEVLLLFSGLMRKTFRSTDLLFRYGGEEFVVVLAPVGEADAFTAFERFRERAAQFSFPQVGRTTVSIGLVRIYAHELSTTVVEHADKALYYAKEHGRNRTCSYHQLLDAGILKEQQHTGDIELF